MTLTDYLDQEWRPALGCTEPACIAWAAATAAAQAQGPIVSVRVACDPRMYKNCYAVGIPNSARKSGILWASALGAVATDPSAGLEIFRQVDPERLDEAGRLIARGAVLAEVDRERQGLFVDVSVRRTEGEGRAVIAGSHTRLERIERDGVPLDRPPLDGPSSAGPDVRETLAALGFDALAALAARPTDADRARLRQGTALNLAIARHGSSLLPAAFHRRSASDATEQAARLVAGGVYARMSGEDFTVMTLAGSGNKGITVAVPIAVIGEELGASPERRDEALALASLVTSATTHRLGALSAVCGCSNAAGIGLAAGLVHLEGGDTTALSAAVTNMVGNVSGMICDGAKIGCALKSMTGVDAAHRAASLALSGVSIPATDGIVGVDGQASLAHLGRIATSGMRTVDAEILAIMREKLES
jgi:L-cysteine desulfidase